MVMIKTNIVKKMIEEINKIARIKLNDLNLSNNILKNDLKLYLENGIISDNLKNIYEINDTSTYLKLRKINSDIDDSIEKATRIINTKYTHINNLNSLSNLKDILDYNIFISWD